MDDRQSATGGTTAAVRFGVQDGELVATVEDEGTDRPASWRPGVGLASMRERADELGGRLEVGGGPRGWRVRAVLPVGTPSAASAATGGPSGAGPE